MKTPEAVSFWDGCPPFVAWRDANGYPGDSYSLETMRTAYNDWSRGQMSEQEQGQLGANGDVKTKHAIVWEADIPTSGQIVGAYHQPGDDYVELRTLDDRLINCDLSLIKQIAKDIPD